jgi:DNA-directed RNA polymerase
VCLPRQRKQQILDLSEHNSVVRMEGCVVKIEEGVVKKCKSVVKTLKTVVKNKQFILHYKSIYIHHERRCTNVLSVLIQDINKIATKLLADSFRPDWWFQYLQALHQQIQDLSTSIQGWDTKKQVLFGKNPCLTKTSTQSVLPLYCLPSNLSRIYAQS